MIFEVTSKDVVDSVNKFYMYVSTDVEQFVATQRTQAGNLIKGGIKDVKNYVEDTLQLDGNSKSQRDYMALYLDSTVGQIFQGLKSSVKNTESN